MIAEKVRERLGVSTMIYPAERYLGPAELAAIRANNISRIEIAADYYPHHFDYKNQQQVDLVRRECEKIGLAIVSFHTPGIQYSSEDEDERKAAVAEAIIVIDVMLSLSGRIFVMHVDIEKDVTRKTMEELLNHYHNVKDLRLVIENGASLVKYCRYVKSYNTPRVGMVIDIGHPVDADGVNPLSKPGRAYEDIALTKGHLLHLHLHDWDGKRDHFAPFAGKLQWAEIFRALFDTAYPGIFMFETADEKHAPNGLETVGRFPELLEEVWG